MFLSLESDTLLYFFSLLRTRQSLYLLQAAGTISGRDRNKQQRQVLPEDDDDG
jgi:hypothetical protein